MKYLLQSHLSLATIHNRKQKINTFLLVESILVLSKLLWVQSPKKVFEMTDHPCMLSEVWSSLLSSFPFLLIANWLRYWELKQPLCDPEVGSQFLMIGPKVPSHLMSSPRCCILDCRILWFLSIREIYALLFIPLWFKVKSKLPVTKELGLSALF